ncbi:hypothetical protein [Caulobacter sp. RHG1]|uniref:hypothetical protein n=1 Tax=Caulobacter sp. (strain RHG1) TaxID=2545762 RepID=UPI0015577DC6|nr:hypothetical protein [Caulobacter sp. RHG1]NQE61452.1 hypothetical protein [Caulobacter sp. RHG1]
MTSVSTWLKQTSRALLACLVLCLSFVPLADALICAADAPAAQAASVQTYDQVTAQAPDHGDKSHRETGGDACVHGHCHHPVTSVAPVVIDVAAVAVSGAKLTPAETGWPPSRGPDGPMEPPRA